MEFGSSIQSYQIALLPGDGFGPELSKYAKQILKSINRVRKQRLSLKISDHPFGANAIDQGHQPLPTDTLQACQKADAVLLCGLDLWNTKLGRRPEKALLDLRSQLGVYANIRRLSFVTPNLTRMSSFLPELVQDLDITFVRDLTGGVYYGTRKESSGPNEAAIDTTEYLPEQVERLARWAGEYAMKHTPPKPVHSVDKANVMATSRLWRSVVSRIFQQEYPLVPLQHVLVDNAAMLLSKRPTALNGIILTENMFGDILSDQVAGITGAIHIHSSAAVGALPGRGDRGTPGMFEPFQLTTTGLKSANPICIIDAIASMFNLSLGLEADAAAIRECLRRTLDLPENIGQDLLTTDLGGSETPERFFESFLHNLDFHLEAVNSAEREENRLSVPTEDHGLSSRPMNLIEKILTNAAIGLQKPEVEPGDMLCVKVDWTITSELLWAGMDKTYEQMNRPRIHRNDRLWLAVDHTVDPRTMNLPKQRSLVEKAEKFREEAKIIDYLPPNTSIMHTDFTRGRAQPGHIIAGSDSHTCSAGSMGAFAVGFGAADVVMPMVTGETWFRVPEVCRINFVGKLCFGITGKDVILHILGLFKRNTIAFQRAVEYGGPSLEELSMDSRFAIANMTTEFGGMGACFEADQTTAGWISKRRLSRHKNRGLYFRADRGARYAEERTIDLSKVTVTIALYPNPDDVVPINERAGMKLDGCFIGACTTTEEELIFAALVLEAGLRMGMLPKPGKKRRVTPGSLVIISNLKKLGLLEIYERAGFEVGAPGCSYCVGINDVDVAGVGEVWLSSQNRNFRNRMGKGSLGNVTSAAAVAASSFDMEVTDPRFLVERIDMNRLNVLNKAMRREVLGMPEVVEPRPLLVTDSNSHQGVTRLPNNKNETTSVPKPRQDRIISAKIQRFKDNVDTDAIIPAEFMPGVDNADLGSHCFEYFRPEFRSRASEGARIIVADHGFGSGSSREDAVRALQGAGILAVIARGFAFIYERNQLNMGLYNVTLDDDDFYDHAMEGGLITIDKDNKVITLENIDGIAGNDRTYRYRKTPIEDNLLNSGGVIALYGLHGNNIFRAITRTSPIPRSGGCHQSDVDELPFESKIAKDVLAW